MAHVWIVFITSSLISFQGLAQIITEGPTSVSVRKGESVTLTCVVDSGQPRWRNPDDVLVSTNRDTIDEDRYHITGDEDNGEYNLQIIGIIEMDHGEWRCTLFGADPAPGNVTVLVPVSTMEIIEDSPITIDEGSNMDISCEVYNTRPAVDISWLIGDELLDSSLYVIVPTYGFNDGLINTTSTLSLTTTSENNGSNLTCRGRNEAMDEDDYVITYVALNVQYGPKERDGEVDFIRPEGDCPVTVTADIHANPSADLVWNYNNIQTNASSIEVRSSKGTMVNCTASNRLGMISSSRTVKACTGLSDPEIIGICLGAAAFLILVIIIITIVILKMKKTPEKANPTQLM